MTELFNLAACKALHMSQPSPPKISIGIEISQPPMNGGLSSIQESMNIGGEPHQLSYINSDEASLLKQLGGSGQPVNGIPAYWAGEGWGSWDGPEQASADASAEAAAAQEADKAAEDEEGLMGMMDFDPAQFDYAHGIADYTIESRRGGQIKKPKKKAKAKPRKVKAKTRQVTKKPKGVGVALRGYRRSV